MSWYISFITTVDYVRSWETGTLTNHKDTLPPTTSLKQLLTKLLSLVNCDEFISSSLDSNKLGYTTKLKHKRLIPDTCLTTLIKCTIKRLTKNCSSSPIRLCIRNKNNRTMSYKLLHMVSIKNVNVCVSDGTDQPTCTHGPVFQYMHVTDMLHTLPNPLALGVILCHRNEIILEHTTVNIMSWPFQSSSLCIEGCWNVVHPFVMLMPPKIALVLLPFSSQPIYPSPTFSGLFLCTRSISTFCAAHRSILVLL